MRHATFSIYTGPMFSSKTSMLLLSLEKHRHQKKNCLVFKPKIDDRYASAAVVSHGGASTPSIPVTSGPDILKYLSDSDEKVDVVAVDEAFMIPGVADALIYLYGLGITVLVSSLELSSACKAFPEVQSMLPWATHVYKLSAACSECGADAYYTYRKDDDDAEIRVGGVELYEPRCRVHHPFFFQEDT